MLQYTQDRHLTGRRGRRRSQRRYSLTAFDGQPIERESNRFTWTRPRPRSPGFKHFMLKGDLRAAQRRQETLAGGSTRATTSNSARMLKIDEIVLRAMTKYRSPAAARLSRRYGRMYLMRALCKLPVEMELASEFRYGDRFMDAAR